MAEISPARQLYSPVMCLEIFSKKYGFSETSISTPTGVVKVSCEKQHNDTEKKFKLITFILTIGDQKEKRSV